MKITGSTKGPFEAVYKDDQGRTAIAFFENEGRLHASQANRVRDYGHFIGGEFKPIEIRPASTPHHHAWRSEQIHHNRMEVFGWDFGKEENYVVLSKD